MGVDLTAFVLGFVLGITPAWLLVPLVSLVMLVGVANPELNLFRIFYLRVPQPRGIVKPNVVEEDAAPHRFANGVGGSFLLAATIAFALNFFTAGWALTW